MVDGKGELRDITADVVADMAGQRWIETAERMPEPGQLVLCYGMPSEGSDWCVGSWTQLVNGPEVWREVTSGHEITEPEWWMPLPGTPAGG